MLNLYNVKNHNSNSQPPQASSGKKKVDYTKYVDPTGEFSSKEMRWSIWYVKHRVFLYKLSVGVLAGLCVIFWGFSLWQWVDYALGLQASNAVDADLSSFINYSSLHAIYGAQPLQIMSTGMFASRENKNDAVAEMTNPNSRFLVSFDYYFVINGEKTPSQRTFLLPGESRPVAYLGIEGGQSGSPSMVLENISWTRISAHKILDVKNWQNYRLDFSASDFVFLKSLAQEGTNSDAIQFNFTNNSPYSYIGPDFYVALLQSGSMVGILPLHLDSIKSLETKSIDLRSLAPGLNVTDIAVYPIINLYDDSVYLTY